MIPLPPPRLLRLSPALAALVLLGCSLVRGPALVVQDDAASVDDAHAALFVSERFPSAAECRTCHPDHYREWSTSPHAYAQVSPVFNAMQGQIQVETSGTLGDFCIRCHTPVGMALEEPLFGPNSERAPVSREGITCIVCHRVSHDFGKVSGRRSLQQGDLFDPVYGPRDGEELDRVLASPDEFGPTVTEPGETGRRIHAEARFFAPISRSAFCGACHDVTGVDGFRLEEAFSEYKASPAARRGETCQDCHMGVEPGVASGYREAPAAVVGGTPTAPRKRTDHRFVGPDYPVVHPGIFPHSPEAAALATYEEWAQFDWEAGWGTDAFEDEVTADYPFPDRWLWPDDRYEAREIVDAHLELRAETFEYGTRLLQRGYRLGEHRVLRADEGGLAFEIDVENGTDGHNVPTGFTAERLVFLRVTVTDAAGEIVFRSGDLDPNGDVRDSHSLYVHDGLLPLDDQLFSLQSRFLTRSLRGGEREEILAVDHSLEPLPFNRPSTFSAVLFGRPGPTRIHKKGIEPGGHRTARYEVDGELLTGAGPWSAEVELVAGMVPVNLVATIQGVGFDYGMSAREVADAIVDGHRVLWKRTIPLSDERP